MLVTIINIVTDEKTGKCAQDQTAGEGLGWSERGARGLCGHHCQPGLLVPGRWVSHIYAKGCWPGRGGVALSMIPHSFPLSCLPAHQLFFFKNQFRFFNGYF